MSGDPQYRARVNERVPILVMVDDGYFGHETLHEELGPTFDVRFASGPLEAHATLAGLDWPIILAPRTLDPVPGDVLLSDLDRGRFDFVGALLLDDEALDRLPAGVHLIVRRPLRPGMLRLHLQAATAQRARLKAERATTAALANDFASLRDGLRHDLRGQLQSVVGLASLVLELERPKRAADDEVLDFMDRIAASGDRLTRFVDALADWLTVARRPLERTSVDLGELCVEVLAKVRTSFDTATIETSLEPSDVLAIGARVTGDARMLQKALEILVERALAMSKTAHVRIAASEAGWTVTVHDICPRPLPAAQCAKAFALFERVAGGDGIGLAIVHKVAERHGASVVLSPVAAGGHEVVLTLPWGV